MNLLEVLFGKDYSEDTTSVDDAIDSAYLDMLEMTYLELED